MSYIHYYQHPAFVILLSVLMLLVLQKRNMLFRGVAIVAPFISAVLIYLLPEQTFLQFFALKLSYMGSFHNKLIGVAFAIALLVANLNAMGRKRHMEIILGNLYGGFTMICLFAGDFFSLFVSLELMAVVSSLIIFIGEHKSSLRSAKKYFITHFTSGSMVMIGIAHLFLLNGSFELQNVTPLMQEMNYTFVILVIMLCGMLINVAAFPFAGWMVNYYPQSSSSGFVYLLLFTTKLSVILLLKVFAGLVWLKYIAVIMMLYACFKVIYEKESLRVLCYFSIVAMGFMMIGISNGTPEILNAVIYYLFLHILYKLILSVACTNIPDVKFSSLFNHNSLIMIFGLCSGMMAMLSMPGTFAFVIKSAISGSFHEDIFYWVIMMMTFCFSFAMPWRYILSKPEYVADIKLSPFTKASILIASITTWCVMLLGSRVTDFSMIEITSSMSLKHIFIIMLGIILGLIVRYKRVVTKSINFVETIGDLIFYFHSISDDKIKEQDEPLQVENVEFQYRRSLQVLHNQQSSIFIVFTLLAIVLYLLII